MKKTVRSITAIVMVVLTLFSCCSVALAAKTEAAELDVVYDANGNRVGFKTITVGETVYYDVFDGKENIDGKNQIDFFKAVLTKKYNQQSILDIWSDVAADVFKIGGNKFGFNYEFDDFDTWYSKNTKDDPNNNVEANADVNLKEQFKNTEPYSAGKSECHCVRASGLQYHSSLNNVQNTMLEQIVDVCGEQEVNAAFKKTVLEFCTPNGEGLELLKDTKQQPVFASVITNQFDSGRFYETTARWFSSFGIAFYDFDLTPIIEENLSFISAADNYDSIEDAFKDGAPGVTYEESDDGVSSVSYIQNPTSADASVGVSTSKSGTYSVSNSFSESDTYSFTESSHVEVELGATNKLKFGIGFSASQAISTAFSESTSLSKTISNSTSVNLSLPPYTEVGVRQYETSSEQTVEYDCPVYVTYKVAIFGMNGEYEALLSNTGSWSKSDYDQGSICVGFGDDTVVGGYKAPENLNNRLQANSLAFEFSHGKVTGMYEDQGDGKDPEQLTYINWNLSSEKETLRSLAKKAMKYIPMSSLGGKLTAKAEYTSSEVTQIYPMYDLERIRFENDGKYTLGIGGKLDLNTVNTIGLNKFDRPYYGYLARMGTWHICDKNGNDITFEEGKGISLEPTPSTQTIIAHEIGEYYVRFDIDEKYYTKASDRATYITNDDLEFTAILKLSVTDTGNNHTCRPGGWITYIPANCIVEGERYKNCLTCSKRMATEVIPKADHIPVETFTPATCNTDGSKTTTCLTCKTIISNEVIPAKGHGKTYSVTTVTPTCTRDGEKALYCHDCNQLVGSETIASTGHDNGVWKIDFEATPEHEGQMTKYCSTCNFALESKTFAYHTHSYTAWGKNGNGTHTRSCYLCSFTETADCDFDQTVTPATCTVDGKTTYKCKDCNYKYSETSSYAQGHDWDTWTATNSQYHSASCKVCGETETTVHIFVEYIPNNDATKDADGTKTATCAVCDATDTVIDEGSKLVDTPEDPADDCSHICHSTGFTSFFWKIIRIFWKLFKMNPVCECGAAHY